MAPHDSHALLQGRDDDDDSGSVYNHPVIMFFGLFLVCVCIMAPMFWLLWMMRNDNREDVVNEEQLHRIRNWSRVKVAQQPIVQDAGQSVFIDNFQTRLSNIMPKMRKIAIYTQQAVASHSQLLLNKISQRVMSVARPVPRRSRSHSRAGVSIELPIMRQPAWQKLVSGSGNTTPSATLGDFSKQASVGIDTTDMVGPSGRSQAVGNGSQTENGILELHGGIDGATGDQLRKSQALTTVGLAVG